MYAPSSPQVLWHSNPVCIETNDIKSLCNPDPETVLIGDFNSKPAPRGGAVEYLNESNPPYAPPNPVRGVVGRTIDRCISVNNSATAHAITAS